MDSNSFFLYEEGGSQLALVGWQWNFGHFRSVTPSLADIRYFLVDVILDLLKRKSNWTLLQMYKGKLKWCTAI